VRREDAVRVDSLTPSDNPASSVVAWDRGARTHTVGRLRASNDRIVHSRRLPNYASASRGNRRSMLLRMSKALFVNDAKRVRLVPLSPSSASAPYSKDETGDLRAWVRLSKGRRNNAMALIALGLGAGLSAREVLSVTRRDIRLNGSTTLVAVHGARSRMVLVNPECSRSLASAKKDSEPADWVVCNRRTTTGKNLVTDFIKKTPTDCLGRSS